MTGQCPYKENEAGGFGTRPYKKTERFSLKRSIKKNTVEAAGCPGQYGVFVYIKQVSSDAYGVD